MKRHAPATARNSVPIADVLERELPARGLVLEIASGSGEHAVFMARRFPHLDWQPTDIDPDALASVDAYVEESGLTNLLPSIALNAAADEWPDLDVAAILCINMVHISPWQATVGLLRNTHRLLPPTAPLILYGPFIELDVETAVSNLVFDRNLKARNPQWGLRDLAVLDELAASIGFARTGLYRMPANNLTLIFRKLDA